MRTKIFFCCLAVPLLIVLVFSATSCGSNRDEETLNPAESAKESSTTTTTVVRKEEIPKVTADELIKGSYFVVKMYEDPLLREKVEALNGKLVSLTGKVDRIIPNKFVSGEELITVTDGYLVYMGLADEDDSYVKLQVRISDETLSRKLEKMNLREGETIIAAGIFLLLEEPDYERAENELFIFGAKIFPLMELERP